MPKKRGNNEGTIRQRKDGTWEARFVAGYSPQGKIIRKSIYADTREKVQKKMREYLRQLDRGEFVEPSKMTYAEWLDTWFAVYGKPKWRDSTAAIHHDNIRLHVKSLLGKHLLQKLRAEHIQAFINTQKGKGYSSNSIRKQLEPIKSSLKQAYENQLIIRNPATSISLPPIEEKEIQFLTVEEQKQLVDALPDNTHGLALRFILGTGLRASELCGLRWCDIGEHDFTIRQGVQVVKGQLSIANPKTKAGKRTIPLTASTKGILDEQRHRQILQRMAVGTVWQGDTPGSGETYVFASEVGTPADRVNLARTLRISLQRAGLKSMGLHALRHTFATNCVRANIDVRTLSEIIGHTKISFTIQRYVHTDMNVKRAAMEALEELF